MPFLQGPFFFERSQMFFKDHATLAITALNVTQDYNVGDSDSVVIGLFSSAFTATISFYASSDGTNFHVMAVEAVAATAPATRVVSATANGLWRIDVSGFKKIRVTCTAFTSATAAVVTVNSARSN